MDKQKAIELAGEYFPNYPSVQEFHVTTDGQVFEQAASAGNHARAFKKADDQEVFAVKRSEWAAATAVSNALKKVLKNAATSEGTPLNELPGNTNTGREEDNQGDAEGTGKQEGPAAEQNAANGETNTPPTQELPKEPAPPAPGNKTTTTAKKATTGKKAAKGAKTGAKKSASQE